MANCKVTMFFGKAKWGWTESFFWTGGTLGLEECEQDAKQLGLYRQGILAESVSLEGMRIQTCDEQGRTFLSGISEILYGRITTGKGDDSSTGENTICANPWISLYVRLTTGDRQYARNYLIRGIPDDKLCMSALTPYSIPFIAKNKLYPKLKKYLSYLCQNGKAVNSIIAPAGTSFDGPAAAGGARGPAGGAGPAGPAGQGSINIAQPDPTFNRSQGRFSFLVKDRAVGRSKAALIEKLLIDPNEKKFYIKPASPATFKQGEKIHIHGLTGPGLRGLNGDTRITGPVGAAGPYVGYYPTSTKIGPVCTVNYLSDAVYWRLKGLLVSPSIADLARIVRKGTGRVYFGTKGSNMSKDSALKARS